MFATIYVPDFYLQATLRHQPELRNTPVALITEQEKKPAIIQLNDAAQNAGIHIGMTPSQALARSLQVTIKVRDPLGEQTMQQTLLQFAFTLSPYVEATAPGLATVQFTDTRDLKFKVAHAVDQLRECNIEAQAGIAPTPDTSFLAAYVGRPVLQVANVNEFLSPLPIETLALA